MKLMNSTINFIEVKETIFMPEKSFAKGPKPCIVLGNLWCRLGAQLLSINFKRIIIVSGTKTDDETLGFDYLKTINH